MPPTKTYLAIAELGHALIDYMAGGSSSPLVNQTKTVCQMLNMPFRLTVEEGDERGEEMLSLIFWMLNDPKQNSFAVRGRMSAFLMHLSVELSGAQ